MEVIKQNNFESLIDDVYQTHCVLQQKAQKAVTLNLTIRNWLVGYYIVEFEQNGKDRAKYGTRLLEEISKRIKVKGIKGLDTQSLRTCRTFYSAYPQFSQIIFQKVQSLGSGQIRGSLTRESQIIKNQQNEICGSATRELPEEYPIPSETLLSRLSFTHFVELLRKDDPLERLFYEVEAIKNNWSVRELERAMNTALYVRIGLSANKEAIIAKFKSQRPVQNVDIIRDPYFLEFLGLEERSTYSESELEQAILNHLQQFLLELGVGFCFEARQKRITFDNTHYRIDLVFYHRILKSHLLIDLKIGKFNHADAGQMNVYLNYYRENEMAEGDNPPIGLILCGDKSEALAKYATSGMDSQLFVSKYLVNLPEKKALEEFIKRELE
ncbi:MAG: PDDEXK nuclease domain-containing protein [Prevotellaceae bacterium]|jgi:predicted nuclease of restriction endonuclease-like (RecB) superfamily|nr:PDDEXK nuclease domain-containing protein [Prevotellaceae bacterium]